MTLRILTYLQISLMLLLGARFAVAHAQLSGTVVAAPACAALSSNLYVGVTDGSTAGQVTQLQSFLAAKGYFNTAHLGTGRFGPLTRSAVIRFQSANSVPATGFVGPLTRAAIRASVCEISPAPMPPEPAPDLQSLTPSSASVGTKVTVTGSGFTTSNNALFDGMMMAQNVPVTSTVSVSCLAGDTSCTAGLRQTLEFMVRDYLAPNCPSGMFCAAVVRPVVPGKYFLTVVNDNGTSDGLVITVTP